MAVSGDREVVQGAQSIDRALTLLSAFTVERPRQRIVELAATAGLGQSTVSRMVAAMVAVGYLVPDANTGTYGLGVSVLDLAAARLNSDPIHVASRQVAQMLAIKTRLGANVAERHGDRLLYLCNFEGQDAPRSTTLLGTGGPLHATGMGKALLLGASDDEINELVGPAPDRYTAHTITDLAVLKQELKVSRERGYTIENQELALRRACIAAPIYDRSGAIVAAISISGPLSVIQIEEREHELAVAIIEAADQVSAVLGYTARAY